MEPKMTNNTNADSEISKLMQDLWDQELHKPDVWNAMVAKFESIKPLSKLEIGLAVISALASISLGLELHWSVGVAGVIGVLFYVSHKRTRARELRQELGLLTQPSQLFPPIAVNKIEMELREKSPEADQYLRAVHAGRRFVLAAFEVKKLNQILNAFDRAALNKH